MWTEEAAAAAPSIRQVPLLTPRGSRAGHVLAELSVQLVLAAVLAAILSAALISQQRLAHALSGRADAAGAVRTAVTVLAEETRFLDPEYDVLGVGSDTIALRAIRGIGIVCGDGEPAAGGDAVVRYRGLREPDPGKDRVVSASGEFAAAVRHSTRLSRSEECGPVDGEALYRWALDTVPPAGTVLVLHEIGSYHLSADLRYRRGGAGRQPLTAARFDSTATRIESVAAARQRRAGDPPEAAALTALRITITPEPIPPATKADSAMPADPIIVPFINAPVHGRSDIEREVAPW
ncbi:MAG TPA: hypothetical protein VNZ57_12270 [Longimicrobiales bacterium]|nr:hypothetical protein [Longimicrobiales bacterium]